MFDYLPLVMSVFHATHSERLLHFLDWSTSKKRSLPSVLEHPWFADLHSMKIDAQHTRRPWEIEMDERVSKQTNDKRNISWTQWLVFSFFKRIHHWFNSSFQLQMKCNVKLSIKMLLVRIMIKRVFHTWSLWLTSAKSHSEIALVVRLIVTFAILIWFLSTFPLLFLLCTRNALQRSSPTWNTFLKKFCLANE